MRRTDKQSLWYTRNLEVSEHITLQKSMLRNERLVSGILKIFDFCDSNAVLQCGHYCYFEQSLIVIVFKRKFFLPPSHGIMRRRP